MRRGYGRVDDAGRLEGRKHITMKGKVDKYEGGIRFKFYPAMNAASIMIQGLRGRHDHFFKTHASWWVKQQTRTPENTVNELAGSNQ